MDVAKRYTIAYKGLKDGLHEFDFRVDGTLFETYESTEIKDGACDVHVSVKRAVSMLELRTSIRGAVTVACDRCLEDCDIPVHFDGKLVVKFSDQTDEYDGEVMWISPSAGELDLTQYIYESIVLSLPYQRVHSDGGCDPEMLARFDIVTGDEFAALEARAGGEAAACGIPGGEWDKLETLREELARDAGKPVHADADNKKLKK